ncbi:hypothetical protein HKBW3S44_00911 [Candidatus Hakubella thermalkaliphila]|uniref:Plasmid pRiA4b Orf3-like domain-containing protein n=1 Tax=Candidatus Hakubella thermalkaliphila TaxID=2754717 RepID=A0A6V8Q694_9ACTN|nr:hypothetical protein [Candidatus Hakubella thermalkaliphila]GFP31156.1 hypothetical protein HKBW3S34_02075 [Candidatus Hakubella thermalkaliphila]GFP37231.1 hypothetical protein HKBW3S44_00911 [Candidatus Hakubella thermalkaliphila]GFP40255.1 hypothetical protein HKBW3S47_01951 [Candidatus Hakubella thermalkaliphila]GFP43808.1 hypothetical protein HKBW3C_02938 [Candidatus Hakubella thermalkaliphila]
MSKKSKKKNRKHIKPESDSIPSFPDRRAMEKTLADIGRLLREREFESIDEANTSIEEVLASGEIPPPPAQTPLEQAQELMYQAWDSSGKRRIELARRALKISEDCADAYVLLAEEAASTLAEAKYLYQQGVQAGERALGEKAFGEDAGHFWGILETRPYMRARAGLAQCLWMLGERDQAIEHFTDMLRLNPNDNQGIRYILATYLLEEGKDEALEKLLAQYKDDCAAAWYYTWAIWTFRREGASKKANSRLREALKQNPFVPAYLLSKKRLPKRLPQYIGFGDESEAVDYASGALEAWRKTPGALGWLEDITEEKSKAAYLFRVELDWDQDVWRKIEILGTQTLHDLHDAIQEAFDWDDDHLYAFFLSNKAWDRTSEYVHPKADGRKANKVQIASLGLRPRKKFLYIFDFGDELRHRIQFLGLRSDPLPGNYPRIVESHGEAPPQYPEIEDEF